MQKHNLALPVNMEGMNLTPYLFFIRDTTGLGWKGFTSTLRPTLGYAFISV